MAEHPKVIVTLNSGEYPGVLLGKVSSFLQGDRTARFQIQLGDHPTLKTVTLKREQIRLVPEKR